MPDGSMALVERDRNKTPVDGGRLQVGAVTAAHGVRGLVRVKSFTAAPSDLTAYGTLLDASGRPVKLTVTGESKGQLLARIEGVADRNAADLWRGEPLFIERDQLPETDDPEEFYHADLIGLAVETLDGEALGTVTALHDFGAGDVLEVEAKDGDVRYLPFTREAVPTVDIAGGKLVANPPVEVGEPEGKNEPNDDGEDA